MRSALSARIAASSLSVLTVAGLLAGPPAVAADPLPLHAAPTPLLWPRSGLEAVSATGPDDVWAVGYQGYQGIDWSVPGWGAGTIHVLPPKGAVVHWNGTSWQTYDPPGAGGDVVIQEVDAEARDNVWITGTIRPHDGSNTGRYLAHWDGTRWKQVATPDDGCGPLHPAADSTGAWFACSVGLVRWEDGRWTDQDTGAPDNCCIAVNEISVVSDESAWAAATWGLLHWDGRSWSKVPGYDDVQWGRVLAVSDTEVWATGSQRVDGSMKRIAVRWDGASWQDFPSPPTGERLIRTGDGAMWALQPTWGELYRLENGAWTKQALPVPGDGQVTGGTAVPGDPGLWLVGKTKNVPVVIHNR
ncbi:hypothetical protein [Spirillospora sp. NBC_01491]|uniref:hypothetical protein n=1 Tax=Spirillospora sp. NBC_01491 TaxID=2976007 RepID=UPI002E311A0E|nr:hypothetical protein [Spirillospora sp. NBC_01491]